MAFFKSEVDIIDENEKYFDFYVYIPKILFILLFIATVILSVHSCKVDTSQGAVMFLIGTLTSAAVYIICKLSLAYPILQIYYLRKIAAKKQVAYPFTQKSESVAALQVAQKQEEKIDYKNAVQENQSIKFVRQSVETRISNNQYKDHGELKQFIISENIIEIGSYAFLNCGNLEEIIIPKKIKSIGWYAFDGCNKLTIYCEAESQPSGWSTLWNNSKRPVYWYREEKPTEEGNYWHYVDGAVTKW